MFYEYDERNEDQAADDYEPDYSQWEMPEPSGFDSDEAGELDAMIQNW